MVAAENREKAAEESQTPLRDAARRRLLAAVLVEVPFTGWTAASLVAAAARQGESPALVERLFPAGIAEILEFWSREADAAMVAWLRTPEALALRTGARAEAAILRRLEYLLPHREAARQAMQQLSFPHFQGGSALGVRLVARTVDELWYGLGDRSADFNWYSKRLLMAGVYLPSLVAWLGDSAPNWAETEAFIQRQMARIMGVSRFGAEVRQGLAGLMARVQTEVQTRVQPRLRAFAAGKPELGSRR